jgi:Ca2+/Na+ antiporter
MLALKKAIIAFAGPLVNLIIMAISIIYYKITEISEIAGISIELLIFVTIILGNLSP